MEKKVMQKAKIRAIIVKYDIINNNSPLSV